VGEDRGKRKEGGRVRGREVGGRKRVRESTGATESETEYTREREKERAGGEWDRGEQCKRGGR